MLWSVKFLLFYLLVCSGHEDGTDHKHPHPHVADNEISISNATKTTSTSTTTTTSKSTPTAHDHEDLFCDHKDMFHCQDELGRCVTSHWVCDGVRDCTNGKDEENCHLGCGPNMMKCANEKCISQWFKCDNFDDCGDESDERDCQFMATPTGMGIKSPPTVGPCPDSHYRCHLGACITKDSVCDGFEDCSEGDDESNCDRLNWFDTCGQNEFQCPDDPENPHHSHICIPELWHCDGSQDCPGGTDEMFCSDEPGQILPDREGYLTNHVGNTLVVCNPDEFACNDGRHSNLPCVSKSKLCDGHWDCRDGSDEGGQCNSCNGLGCELGCIESPLGPKCVCPEGMEVGSDWRTCQDVNECVREMSGCDHFCQNLNPGFSCSCAQGFRLMDNKLGCQLVDGDRGAFLVAFGNKLRSLLISDTDTSYTDMLQHKDMVGLIYAMDYSWMNDRIYMGIIGGPEGNASVHVMSPDAPNDHHCLIENIDGLSNIATDWVTGNIYYVMASPSPYPDVGVCDPEGRFCRSLVDMAHIPGPVNARGLALHPGRGLVFYSLWGKNPSVPRIESMGMDGSHAQILVEGKMVTPHGLAIDFIREHLYWVDGELGLIERVDIHGYDRKVIASDGVHHPFDLLIFHNRLYWADWGVSAVLSADIRNSSNHQLIQSLPASPFAIALNHSAFHRPQGSASSPADNSRQENPCAYENGGCSHICVLAFNKLRDERSPHMCLCPHGYRYRNAEMTHCEPAPNGTSTIERAAAHLNQKPPQLCQASFMRMCHNGGVCQNGGSCVESTSSFSDGKLINCLCGHGYKGKYCEVADELLLSRGRSGRAGRAFIVLMLLFLMLFLVVAMYLYYRKNYPNSHSLLSKRVPVGRSYTMRFRQQSTRPNDRTRILHNESSEDEHNSGFANPVYEKSALVDEEARSFYDSIDEQHNNKVYPTAPPRSTLVRSVSANYNQIGEDNDSGVHEHHSPGANII